MVSFIHKAASWQLLQSAACRPLSLYERYQWQPRQRAITGHGMARASMSFRAHVQQTLCMTLLLLILD